MRMQRPTGASVTMALSCEDGARRLGGQSGASEVYAGGAYPPPGFFQNPGGWCLGGSTNLPPPSEGGA